MYVNYNYRNNQYAIYYNLRFVYELKGFEVDSFHVCISGGNAVAYLETAHARYDSETLPSNKARDEWL